MDDANGALTWEAIATPFPPCSEADWQARVAAVLKGASAETLRSMSADAIPIEPLYRRRADAVPVPGIRAAIPWGIVQRVDDPDTERANQQALDDLENGASGLAVAFMGSQAARGFGLAAEHADFASALAGVDLNLIALRLDAGPDQEAAVSAVCALVAGRNLSPDTLSIDWGIDAAGSISSDAIRRLSDLGYAGPVFRADGRAAHEAGASEAQELAVLLAAGVAGLRALVAAGSTLEKARNALSFLAVADHDLLLSVSKLRALRRLWARVEEACGLVSKPIRLHAETAWRMLATADVDTNLLRNTIAVFAAAIGGADSIGVLPHTSPHGLPEAHARRIARNTQLVLAHEANLWRVSDPAAASGAFEALTDALCETAWPLFQAIEAEGGMARALESGHVQAMIAKSRAERAAALAEGRATIVGTSRYPNPAEAAVSVLATSRMREPAGPLPSLRDSELLDVAATEGQRGRR